LAIEAPKTKGVLSFARKLSNPSDGRKEKLHAGEGFAPNTPHWRKRFAFVLS
jgi:hypothetical protein